MAWLHLTEIYSNTKWMYTLLIAQLTIYDLWAHCLGNRTNGQVSANYIYICIYIFAFNNSFAFVAPAESG